MAASTSFRSRSFMQMVAVCIVAILVSHIMLADLRGDDSSNCPPCPPAALATTVLPSQALTAGVQPPAAASPPVRGLEQSTAAAGHAAGVLSDRLKQLEGQLRDAEAALALSSGCSTQLSQCTAQQEELRKAMSVADEEKQRISAELTEQKAALSRAKAQLTQMEAQLAQLTNDLQSARSAAAAAASAAAPPAAAPAAENVATPAGQPVTHGSLASSVATLETSALTRGAVSHSQSQRFSSVQPFTGMDDVVDAPRLNSDFSVTLPPYVYPSYDEGDSCQRRFHVHNITIYTVRGTRAFETPSAGNAERCMALCCARAPRCTVWLFKDKQCQLFAPPNPASVVIEHSVHAEKSASLGLPIYRTLPSIKVRKSQFNLARGFTIEGRDVTRRTAPVASIKTVDDCARLCADNKRCNGFTLVERHCWLKELTNQEIRPLELDRSRSAIFVSGWLKDHRTQLRPLIRQRVPKGQHFILERYMMERAFQYNHLAVNFVDLRTGLQLPQPQRLQRLRTLLTAIHKWFAKVGLDYWLDASTLLGAVRDSQLLPWDEDLDIGYRESDFPAILKAAEEVPIADDVVFIATLSYWLPGKIVNTTSGTYCDMFGFSEKGNTFGRLHRRVPKGYRPGRRQVPTAKFFPLRDCTSFGQTFRCPGNAEALLEQLYSPKWRTPVEWKHT